MKSSVRIAALLAIMGLVPATGLAQTVIQVPFDKGKFAWDPNPEDPANGVGPTRWVLINCGGGDVRVDMPQTSIPINQVVSGPGSYTCTIKAANNYGPSSAVSFPGFEAGYIPGAVGNVRIEVQ